MGNKTEDAEAVQSAYQNHNYNIARALLKSMARDGIVSYQEADKINDGTAMILVDGEVVGQASRLLAGWSYAELNRIKGYR